MAATKRASSSRPGKRVAFVAGLRTPFARQATAFHDLSTVDLARMVVNEMFARFGMDPALTDLVVFGQVLPFLSAPNLAREIILGTNMSPHTVGYSVSMACASSLRAIASVAEAIMDGSAEIGVAGGADSASVVPITVSRRLAGTLLDLTKAKSLQQRIKILSKIKLSDLAPVPPAVKEFSTGLSMGEHGEIIAKDFGISREEQDAFAHRSHTLASAAWNDGKLDGEVMHAYAPPFKAPITQDNNIRHDSKLEAYARLKPAFDRKHGTLTAANSTPLTDGAAAVLMMREDKAKALGYQPLGYLRGFAFSGLDPHHLLLGPAHATPIALERAGVKFKDLDLIDMHEAFAAQILANIKAFGSKQFAREKLDRASAIGEVELDRFNVLGGSIAYGHPFAATGARMVTQTLRELKRRGGGLALATACAAGGLGAAMILEVER